MTDSSEPTAKVLFEVPQADGSCEIETLWAVPLGGDLYKLDNSPFYAYSVSWNDVVLAPYDSANERPTFERVVAKSGHRTVRIRFEMPALPGNASDKVLQDLVAMGCTYEGADSKLISVDIPPEVDLSAVRAYLIASGVTWEHADPSYEDLFGSEASR